MMADFPINVEDAGKEIKALINEKGLEVITSKIIRKHLEAKFNCNFEEHKLQLDSFIENCIVELQNEEESSAIIKKDVPKMGKIEPEFGKSPPSDSTDTENEFEKSNVAKPKRKTGSSNSLKRQAHEMDETVSEMATDEAEDMATAIKRRRSTAVTVTKKKEKQNKPKDKPRKGKGTMYTKVCALSPELSSLLGKRYLRRSDVVKEMWSYLRSHDLQDPKNGQFYFLDEPLRKIFGKNTKKFKAFGMMSTLKKHVKDIEHLDEATRQIAETEIREMLATEEEDEKASKTADETNKLAQEDDSEGEEEQAESNDEKEEETLHQGAASQMKVETEESNISHSSQQSSSKSEDLDTKPSTSMSAYQQPEEEEEEAQNGGQGSSNSSESSTSSSDDSEED